MTHYEHQRGVEIAKDHQILFDGDFEFLDFMYSPIGFEFDGDFDVLDCIHLNGKEYYIIKQKNFFFFANRLNIYKSDSSVIRDSKLSKSIFEIYAWKQQIDKLNAMDRSDLRGVLTTSENIASKVAPLHQGTGTVVSAIDEAKAVEVMDISVWDTAAKLNPELKRFENTVRNFDTQVGEWDSASSNVNANLPDVIKGLDSIDRGEKIEWTAFAYDTKASVTAFNELSRKTSQMSYRVSNIRETLNKLNKGLSSIGAGFLADAFSDLDGKLGSVNDSIVSYTSRLEKYSREFSAISRDVDRIERNIDNEWKHSLDEELSLKLIYCLLVFVFIGIVMTIITLLTDFRKRLKEEGVKKVMKSSVVCGILMFFGSIVFGILMILAFVSDASHRMHSLDWTYEIAIDIPFLSVYSQPLDMLCIFLTYIAVLIVLFGLIYGVLAKNCKVCCISWIWIANIGPLLALLVGLVLLGEMSGEVVTFLSIVLPSLFLASLIYACLCYFFKPEIFSDFKGEVVYLSWWGFNMFCYFTALTISLIYKTARAVWELNAPPLGVLVVCIIAFFFYFLFIYLPILICLSPLLLLEGEDPQKT